MEIYVVRGGDSLYGIARRYGTDAAELARINQLNDPARLVPGMTIAVEPMINAGAYPVKVLSNQWTVVTVDGSLAAHYENSILITEGDPEILTRPDEEEKS